MDNKFHTNSNKPENKSSQKCINNPNNSKPSLGPSHNINPETNSIYLFLNFTLKNVVKDTIIDINSYSPKENKVITPKQEEEDDAFFKNSISQVFRDLSKILI